MFQPFSNNQFITQQEAKDLILSNIPIWYFLLLHYVTTELSSGISFLEKTEKKKWYFSSTPKWYNYIRHVLVLIPNIFKYANLSW